MKGIFHTIHQNRYFLLFILLFAYGQSIYSRILVRQYINIYTFTPEAAVAQLISAGFLFLIILYLIRKWQKPQVIDVKTLLKVFVVSLLIFVVSTQLFGLLTALAFDKMEQNFNQHTWTMSLISVLLNGIIYGGFFLAYYYYHSNRKHQLKLASYHEAWAESRISQLKSQLNPHFLFNNLNVLDQLIEEDKQKASDFLNEFAEIYRYVLNSTEKGLVTISEEIDFAQQYFKLIRFKYGNAYQLNIQQIPSEGFIAPLTLQLLIENAVQHNLGTVENPVCIEVDINENLMITNNIILKRNNKSTSGRALNNLSEQYRLLSEKPVEICENDHLFKVTIPLIYK